MHGIETASVVETPCRVRGTQFYEDKEGKTLMMHLGSPANKCQEVNKKFLLLKKGRTYPLVKISFFKRYGFVKSALFYAAMLHLAALYCLICSCGGMISKGLLSRSIANIMLHTLCETAPIATSFGFDSHFLR